jgi:hypothetical protein
VRGLRDRAPQYRQYEIAQSPILRLIRYFQQVDEPVTKPMLLQLINAVINWAPKESCLAPPPRNQRRAKAGLVLWLDQHHGLVQQYFAAMRRLQ